MQSLTAAGRTLRFLLLFLLFLPFLVDALTNALHCDAELVLAHQVRVHRDVAANERLGTRLGERVHVAPRRAHVERQRREHRIRDRDAEDVNAILVPAPAISVLAAPAPVAWVATLPIHR